MVEASSPVAYKVRVGGEIGPPRLARLKARASWCLPTPATARAVSRHPLGGCEFVVVVQEVVELEVSGTRRQRSLDAVSLAAPLISYRMLFVKQAKIVSRSELRSMRRVGPSYDLQPGTGTG
jgi:hypothetical protein